MTELRVNENMSSLCTEKVTAFSTDPFLKYILVLLVGSSIC
jgi:hypothetical protein